MFWIHGGGNTSGLKDIYDFSGLVKKEDVIVVSINYRVGTIWMVFSSINSKFQTMGLIKHLTLAHFRYYQSFEWVNQKYRKIWR